MYIYIYMSFSRSKGPRKEFYLRKPCMLCWKPPRKFFFEFAKVAFFSRKFRESWISRKYMYTYNYIFIYICNNSTSINSILEYLRYKMSLEQTEQFVLGAVQGMSTAYPAKGIEMFLDLHGHSAKSTARCRRTDMSQVSPVPMTSGLCVNVYLTVDLQSCASVCCTFESNI